MSGGFSDAGAVFPAGALHIPLYPGLLCPGRRTGWQRTGGNRHLYAGTGEWGADARHCKGAGKQVYLISLKNNGCLLVQTIYFRESFMKSCM